MLTTIYEVEARERFRRSVTQAQMADLLGMVTGADTSLYSYDEVASRLNARQQIDKGTRMVPMEQIVGSVGRYRDFTRSFLPRAGVNQERWTRLDTVLNSLEGFPPIDLLKLGEVYFVRDGNHRVSVARANGATHMEAYVTEIETDVPLTLDDFERDQWIIKIEHKKFMDDTQLDRLRPDHNIIFTEPGRYAMLRDHIEVHRYLRDLELERAGSPNRLEWFEAVESWYDNVYLPVVEAIRQYELLRNFPGRTEADLYMWITLHRERLAIAYGLAPLSPSAAVSTFAQVYSDTLVQRTVKGLLLGLHRVLGDDRPMGMSEEEFLEARARHEAGELTLAEAEQRLEQQAASDLSDSTRDMPESGGIDGELDEPAHDRLSMEEWHPRTGQRPEL